MADDIKPTRSELMKLKKRIKLAQSGYNLLKKKRDGLILDFFEILKKAKSVRAELAQEYAKALEKMNMARILESDLAIKSVAMAAVNRPDVGVKKKNIMGVSVPDIETKGTLRKSFDERGFGMFTSASIDETAEGYEKVVEKIIAAAETETALRKLLHEIEKTKRRVNALEFELIPRLHKSRKFISLRLEEMERENTFRLKRIKGD